jgi:hypothetical protein
MRGLLRIGAATLGCTGLETLVDVTLIPAGGVVVLYPLGLLRVRDVAAGRAESGGVLHVWLLSLLAIVSPVLTVDQARDRWIRAYGPSRTAGSATSCER